MREGSEVIVFARVGKEANIANRFNKNIGIIKNGFVFEAEEIAGTVLAFRPDLDDLHVIGILHEGG